MPPIALRGPTAGIKQGDISVIPQDGLLIRKSSRTVIFPPGESVKKNGLISSPKVTALAPPPIQTSTVCIGELSEAQPTTTNSSQAVSVSAGNPIQLPASSVQMEPSSSVSESAVEVVDSTAEPPKPRTKRKAEALHEIPVPLENLKFLTIAQTALRYPVFSEKALRHIQAQAENYQKFPKPGLRSAGFINCILRPGGKRKIIIDAEKFEQWLAASHV